MAKTESETRRELINSKLHLARWDLNNPTQVIEELDIDLVGAGIYKGAITHEKSGHQYADYALFQQGKPVAVIEAKKASKDAEVGKEQGSQYALNLRRIHGGRTPFVFYTNGHKIFFWDMDNYPPSQVTGYPTRDDMEWMRQRNESKKPLSVELINTDIAGRGYQIEAIRTVLEGIEQSTRKFLLVMATGSGKTRTVVALADVLRRARWAKRVLFLVDRLALQEQALEAFEEHIPAAPQWPHTGEKGFNRTRQIYVTTYPTMLNLIENGTTPDSWISPFFFDLIVADESHRSVYNVYRQVLDYFHGLKVGLTATPTDRIDHDTFSLFDRPVRDPTYAYTFEEAIAHEPPYLSDYEVLNVRSKFQVEGIHAQQLSHEVKESLTTQGIDLGDIDFEGTDLEKKVTNSGTNALILREFMEESIKDATGVLPGKSILFAVSKDHARRLCELFDSLYPEFKGKLARVLVSEDKYVYGKGGLLDQFKNKDMPRIAISVDMLDTGVDIPEVVNLVFAKPVYSFTKFWQMIGRGTRVLNPDPAKRKNWCAEKDRFLIIDCWNNFEYFDLYPKGREPGEQVPLPVRLFRARLDQLEAATAANHLEGIQAAKAALRADLAALPENNVIVLEHQSDLARVKEDLFWDNLVPNKDLGFLRMTIAPLMRARSEIDSKVMRFEVEVVEYSAAQLSENQAAMSVLKQSIVAKVDELPMTVNVVAEEQAFIATVKDPAWWSTATIPKLDELTKRLSPLMRYRQQKKDPIMHLDLKDLVAVKDWVEVGPEKERITTAAYRERFEARVQALLNDHPVLAKLRAGEEVTSEQIDQLAVILHDQDPYVTEDLLRAAYDHKTAHFLDFIRHVLGLETLGSWPEKVSQAFEEFIAQHTTFSAGQIQFLQTLRTFILQRGSLEKSDLVKAPFTQLHPDGIRGVFQKNEIDEILSFTRRLVA